MEPVSTQFEQAQQLLCQLLKKVEHKEFPTDNETYNILQILDNLSEIRTTGIRGLQESGIDDVDYSFITNLDELRQAQARQEDRGNVIRTIASTFLSVQCTDEEYTEALQARQQELAACSEAELFAKGRTGELDSYATLIFWIRKGRPRPADERRLKQDFGYQIAFALLDSRFSLPGEKTATSNLPGWDVTRNLPAIEELAADFCAIWHPERAVASTGTQTDTTDDRAASTESLTAPTEPLTETPGSAAPVSQVEPAAATAAVEASGPEPAAAESESGQTIHSAVEEPEAGQPVEALPEKPAPEVEEAAPSAEPAAERSASESPAGPSPAPTVPESSAAAETPEAGEESPAEQEPAPEVPIVEETPEPAADVSVPATPEVPETEESFESAPAEPQASVEEKAPVTPSAAAKESGTASRPVVQASIHASTPEAAVAAPPSSPSGKENSGNNTPRKVSEAPNPVPKEADKADENRPVISTPPFSPSDLPSVSGRFRDRMRRMPALNCGVLMLLTNVSPADEEALAAFSYLLTFHKGPKNAGFVPGVRSILDSLTAAGFTCRHTSEGRLPFYSLSGFTITSLQFPSTLRDLTRITTMQTGHRRFEAKPGMSEDFLLQEAEHSRLLALYMLFVKFVTDSPRDSSRTVSASILQTLTWMDDHYLVDVPTSARPITCTVCFTPNDIASAKGPSIYMGWVLPRIPAKPSFTLYGFLPGNGIFLWRGKNWFPIRRLQWEARNSPLPWPEDSLETELMCRFFDLNRKPSGDSDPPAQPETREAPEGTGPAGAGRTGDDTGDQVFLPGFELEEADDEDDEDETSGGESPQDSLSKEPGAGRDHSEAEAPVPASKESAADREKPAAEPPATSQEKTVAKKPAPSTKKSAPRPAPAPVEEPAPAPPEPVPEPERISSRDFAGKLLEQKLPPQPDQLMELTVLLIAEDHLPEAAAMAEVLARMPGEGAAPCERFYHIFRQSIRIPDGIYTWSSATINEQQSALAGMNPRFQRLEQTMILSNLLWAMAFPTDSYDHKLYNSAQMAVSPDASNGMHQLLGLLGGALKDISFLNDGLGFSPAILSSLAGNDQREQQIQDLQKLADVLKTAPTSSISLRGLETCLKRMVGPASPIGMILARVAANDAADWSSLSRQLEEELGAEELTLDERLEAYIDRSWNELRQDDASVKVKRLYNDTPARRVCKKALSERVDVIHRWIELVSDEQVSNFTQYKDRYARLLNQTRTLLTDLLNEEVQSPDPCTQAGNVILHHTLQQMLRILDGEPDPEYRNFWFPLCLTPELILNETGENQIIPDLYHLKGLEPWTFLLRAVASGRDDPSVILTQIENYESTRWYRNYGTEALILAQTGAGQPDSSIGIQNAERAARLEVDNFRSEARLNRAYGKIQEQTMETAFTVLDLVQELYFRSSNFASFSLFLSRLDTLLDRDIEEQTAFYEKQYASLAADERYAGLPLLQSIRKILDNQNFTTADSCINQLQNGVTELPASERALEQQENFLGQFLSLEKGYYQECRAHEADKPSNWGEHSLESLGPDYRHWSSSNERRKGLAWLDSWPARKNMKNTRLRIQELLNGLGFHVNSVLLNDTRLRSPAEVYEVSAERTPGSLKDYPHPIFKFGTDLEDPFYLVFLPNCKGESALISLMDSDAAPNGPTIVLMDGSLTSTARHTVATTFKQNTARQYPFLFIDRVLLLYLASLDEGDRMKALLRCTLPYTFEQLYSNGVGAIPDEMFIGRTREMNQLCSLQGPNLVFGGRQLGKTALLTRASKIIHDPANGDYSFVVDVKDSGVETLLEEVSRTLYRMHLLSNPSHTIEDLCEALLTLYEENRFRRLCIFVDEADHLFEEFMAGNFTAIRPIVNLRDQTRHHVKFVFAGTHNVAAMDTAEKGNSNLMHIKSSLCIGPMSVSDATRLIRVPLAYLGFDIGDSQIELILSNTNNYPGLIQAFCRALVTSVCRDYSSYYSEIIPGSNPPYSITDEQMRAVFREQDIRKEIGIRIMSTIRLNRRYRVISCMLAQMIYEDRDRGTSRLFGYSARDLKEYNRQELNLTLLNEISESNLTVLLDEMVRMNILWKNDETGEYRFQQRDFLSYIGTSEYVLEVLLADGEEAEHDAG